jgi:hypothetical protein
MPQEMADKPQRGKKHPDEWNRDLNPDRLAGQNIGGESEDRELGARTAHEVKRVHRGLSDFPDDELKQIPILEAGTRLRQGATYLDLDQGEFTATGGMSVEEGHAVVPKDRVHFDTWNKLVSRDTAEK